MIEPQDQETLDLCDGCPDEELLRHRLNPCDYARFRVLAPLGDGIATLFRALMYGTGGCPCCMGTRLIVYTLMAAGIGYGVGAWA